MERPNLNRVWASGDSSETKDPGDSKYKEGWVAEIPTYQVLNYLQNKIDLSLLSLGERGVFEWGSDISYKLNALVWNESDGQIYVSKVAVPDTNLSPDKNPDQWEASSVQITRTEFDNLNKTITDHINSLAGTNPHQLGPHDVDTYSRNEIDNMVDKDSNANAAHIADMSNPHQTTAEKAGAVPIEGGEYTGTVTMGSGVTNFNSDGSAKIDSTGSVLGITVNNDGLGIDSNGEAGIINSGIFTPFGTAATLDATTSPTDSIAGRVLKVGDFGVGQSIQIGSDADPVCSPVDIISTLNQLGSGFYRINTGISGIDSYDSCGFFSRSGDVSTLLLTYHDTGETYAFSIDDASLSAGLVNVVKFVDSVNGGFVPWIQAARTGGCTVQVGDSGTGLGNSSGALVLFSGGANVARIDAASTTLNTDLYGFELYDYGQRVYSLNNPPPRDWAVTAIRQTTDSVLSTPDSATTTTPGGAYLSGLTLSYNGSSGTHVTDIRYRYEQYLLNGNWINSAMSAMSAIQSEPQEPALISDGVEITTLTNLSRYRPVGALEVLQYQGQEKYTAHYISAEGYDWNDAALHMVGTVFIAYSADGVIQQISTDATQIFPDGLSVSGLDSIPDGCEIGGLWKFDGTIVYQDTDAVAARVLAENTDLRLKYAAQAALAISTLQAGIASDRSVDGDSDALTAWQGYLCDLRAMTTEDLQQSPASFPDAPRSIL